MLLSSIYRQIFAVKQRTDILVSSLQYMFSFHQTFSWRVFPSDCLSNMFLYIVKALLMFSLISYRIPSLIILMSNKKNDIQIKCKLSEIYNKQRFKFAVKFN